jgi:hypothetical protein
MRRRADAKVIFEFFKDIDQGRRFGNTVGNGKTQSVGLARAVVRILANKHHLDLPERSMVKGIKNEGPRRKYPEFFLLFQQKTLQFQEIGFIKFRGKNRFPAFFNGRIDVSHILKQYVVNNFKTIIFEICCLYYWNSFTLQYII